jgi:tetratricopeptide (TPR) repeat protein
MLRFVGYVFNVPFFRALLIAGALLILAGYVGWHALRTGSSSAPHSTASPFRNTHPGVRYVGDEACAGCHAELAETFRHHPMGRTFPPVFDPDLPGTHAPGTFDADGFRYVVESRDGQLVHKEIRLDRRGRERTTLEAAVQFAVGSGRRGRTFLVNRDGLLVSSPVSWFREKNGWDLTPGCKAGEHFDFPIQSQCLFCHSDGARPVVGTINRFQLPLARGHGIGCERCHGPGELHVAAREAGTVPDGVEDTIVNPRHLAPDLREAVCQQCHLHGQVRIERPGHALVDYRPGLPLHEYLSVFVRAPEFTDHQKAVSHAEQVYASRCSKASNGKLGCISCHDPHALPAENERAAYYRNRCLACHQEQSCALPLASRRQKTPEDSCIVCHMPRFDSNFAHTAVTDHRILRRPQPTDARKPEFRALKPGEVPLIHFHRDLVDPNDPGVARDLGVALVELGKEHPYQLGRHAAAVALPLLERAVEAAPDDVAAWEAKGYALWLEDQKAPALADLETALTKAPHRETALLYAAMVATALGRTDDALAYWKRAADLNPWPARSHYERARMLAERRQWPEALAECKSALRGDPANTQARLLLVTCLAQTGKAAEARAEFETVLALSPEEDQEILRRWFAEQIPKAAKTGP